MTTLLFLAVVLAGPSEGPVLSGRPLADWVRDLTDHDPLVREEAVEVLAQAGQAAKDAAPRLEKMAHDEPLPLRLRAAVALWRITGKNGPAVEALGETLRRSRSLAARRAALNDLRQLGPAAAAAVPVLLELLDDPETSLRTDAQGALGSIGVPAVTAAVERLGDKEVRVRRRAARAVASLSHLARESAADLKKHLADEDLTVRAGCARVLWYNGDFSAPVLDALAAAVRDGSNELRQETFAGVTSILDPPRMKALRPVVEAGLKGPDALTRMRAAQVMYLIDHKADDVLPILIKGLEDRRREVWSAAALSVGKLGPAGAPALPALVRLAASTDEVFSFELQEAFAGIGPAAVGPLVEFAGDPKAPQQQIQKASILLTRLGPTAAPKLLPLLDHQNPALRQLACNVLGNAPGEARRVVPRLAERLKDDNLGVRMTALNALSHFGPAGRAAVPQVIESFKAADTPDHVRFLCLSVLAQIGAADPAVKELAVGALDNSNAMTRAHAIVLLQAIDPRHPEILPRALKALDDPTGRYVALQVLQRMGPAAAPAVEAMRERLRKDPNIYVRMQIATALADIGPAARAAAPDLIDLLKERGAGSRQNVLQALRRLGGADPAKLIPVLLDLARQEQGYVRGQVLDALGEQGPAAAEAVPLLLDELRKSQGGLYEQAARALGRIAPERARKDGLPLVERWSQPGPNELFGARLKCLLDPRHKQAMMLLRRTVRRNDPGRWFERQQAADALGALGPAARDAAPELDEAMRDKQAQVRLSAAFALWRVNPKEPEPAVRVLVKLLASEQPQYVRQLTIQRLQEMGPAARAALPALREMRTSADQILRQLSEAAVRAIDPPAAPAPPK
jgi:HEAT repeat protein